MHACRLDLSMLIGGLRLGTSLSITDFVQFEVFLLLRHSSQAAFMPALNVARSDLTLTPRHHFRSEATVSACRSAALEETLPALDIGNFGSSLPLRAPSQLNLFLSASGMHYHCSSLFSHSTSHLGFLLPIMNLARSEPFLPVFDCCLMGPSMFVKGFAQLGSFLELSGVVAIEYLALLSVSDCTSFGVLTLIHSFTRLGLPALTSDFSHLGSFSAPQTPGWAGSITSLCGYSRLELTPPVVSAMLSSSLFLHSFAHSGFSLALATVILESPLFPRSCGHLDILMLLLGTLCLGLTPSCVGAISLEFSLLVRSCCCLGSLILVLDMVRTDFLLSLQVFSQLDASPSSAGRHAGQFLLIWDSAFTDASLFVQSCTELGITLSVSEHSHAELLASPKSLAKTGPVLPLSIMRLGAPLSAFDVHSMGAPFFLHSCI